MIPAQQVIAWNDTVKIGDTVKYNGQRVTTRGRAQMLWDSRAVVWLTNSLGAVDLDLVTPE